MKIIIQSPDFKASKKLTKFAMKNVASLNVWKDRIIQCDILLKLNNSNTNDNKVCELKLEIPGNDLFASNCSSTFEGAIANCIHAVKSQLTRKKEYIEKKKRHAPASPF